VATSLIVRHGFGRQVPTLVERTQGG